MSDGGTIGNAIGAVVLLGVMALTLVMLFLTFDRLLEQRIRQDECRLYGHCPSAFDACQYRGERCDEARAILAGGARG